MMIERIREQMKKAPNFPLWDKDFKSWTKGDFILFDKLEKGFVKIRASQMKNQNKKQPATWNRPNSIRVMRVSDGEIYKSISECRFKHGYSSSEIYKLLKESIHYKKI